MWSKIQRSTFGRSISRFNRERFGRNVGGRSLLGGGGGAGGGRGWRSGRSERGVGENRKGSGIRDGGSRFAGSCDRRSGTVGTGEGRALAGDDGDAQVGGDGLDGSVKGFTDIARGRIGSPLGCRSHVSGPRKWISKEGWTNGERQRQHQRRETEQRLQGPRE